MKERFLIVGSGGREGAFAAKLAKDAQIYAVIGHKNSSIIDCVEQSGGVYVIGDINDANLILDFAKDNKIDYAFVSSDEPLANGVIDVLIAGGIRAIGPTKEAARIEWDKVYSIEMMKKTCPEFTPFYRIISKSQEIDDILDEFESRGLQVVVKPQGLTGGKGVKVMPQHLADRQQCTDYISQLLRERSDEQVLVVEKLQGIEFTIMGITDGIHLVMSPASYDYPFRCEGDTGPGTGGMGCFTDSNKRLPFMSQKDFDDCKLIMQKILYELRTKDLSFNGVLNGGFFKTRHGIRFMEFNCRFGDPEGLNILGVLDSSFSEILTRIWDKTLSDQIVSFANKASVVKYLVAKEYPAASPDAVSFDMDDKQMAKLGVDVYFGACIRTEKDKYQTMKKSRVVALVCVSDSITTASDTINHAIKTLVSGPLEYREDIGSTESLKKLDETCKSLA